MSNFNPLLQRNQTFVDAGVDVGLSPMPTHQVIVVTCMDGRVDPAHFLGINLGDALVIRNAGGRVTHDVLQEIAFVAAATELMLGDAAEPFEVAVIHHTSCGSGLLADAGFRATMVANTGADEKALLDSAVTNPHESVQVDVALLGNSPILPERARVSGHVYDVDSGIVTTVVPTS